MTWSGVLIVGSIRKGRIACGTHRHVDMGMRGSKQGNCTSHGVRAARVPALSCAEVWAGSLDLDLYSNAWSISGGGARWTR